VFGKGVKESEDWEGRMNTGEVKEKGMTANNRRQ